MVVVRIRRDLVSGVGGVGALDSARAESYGFRLGDFGVGRFAVSGSWCGLAVGGERELFSKRAFFFFFLFLFYCIVIVV